MRLSVLELSKHSNVGVATIKRLEAVDGLPAANVRTVDAIQRALESLGIEFIGSSGDRPGVRLKAPKRDT